MAWRDGEHIHRASDSRIALDFNIQLNYIHESSVWSLFCITY